MLTTFITFVFVLCINEIGARKLQIRATDSLSIMRERCSQTPNVDECTRVKQQMEDLLRKCSAMATPVPACDDVKSKYCFIWSREFYCSMSGGGGGGGGSTFTTKAPWSSDSDWSQVPNDPDELRRRGDYCVAHQSEQKCRNLLTALKIRYDECAKQPKTDYSCQSFKVSLCSAFPKFSPCLNSPGGLNKRLTLLETLLRRRAKVKEIPKS